MTTTTIKTKYYAYPEPKVAQILGGASSTAYNAALEFAAQAYFLAQERLERDLTRKDWMYLADVLNSTWTDPQWTGACLALEVSDAHRLNGTGEKWYGTSAADKHVAELVAKMRAWDYMTAQALLCAIRFFWEHSTDVDALKDEWWTMPYRFRHVAGHAVGKAGK